MSKEKSRAEYYEKFSSVLEKARKSPWNKVAFLGGFAWLLYKKMLILGGEMYIGGACTFRYILDMGRGGYIQQKPSRILRKSLRLLRENWKTYLELGSILRRNYLAVVSKNVSLCVCAYSRVFVDGSVFMFSCSSKNRRRFMGNC